MKWSWSGNAWVSCSTSAAVARSRSGSKPGLGLCLGEWMPGPSAFQAGLWQSESQALLRSQESKRRCVCDGGLDGGDREEADNAGWGSGDVDDKQPSPPKGLRRSLVKRAPCGVSSGQEEWGVAG